MKTFEYRVFNIHQGPENDNYYNVEYDCNRLGEEGWEAVVKIRKWYANDEIERSWPIYAILFKREINP